LSEKFQFQLLLQLTEISHFNYEFQFYTAVCYKCTATLSVGFE